MKSSTALSLINLDSHTVSVCYNAMYVCTYLYIRIIIIYNFLFVSYQFFGVLNHFSVCFSSVFLCVTCILFNAGKDATVGCQSCEGTSRIPVHRKV